MTEAERRKQGEQLLNHMLGKSQTEQVREIWRDVSPEFEEYVVEFVAGNIWSRSGLDRRTKSLVSIATLASLNRPLALELNIRFALNNGATRQDIVETFLQIAPYAGFPVTWEGLTVAKKVFREMDGK
jgi:4-carboxymuconolactone decarboxylase